MTPVWAQRQKALLNDCVVFPDVFHHMVDRLGDFVAPYQHALETEAGQRNVHLYLQGLLSHLPRKNAEGIATLVNVERLVLQEFIGTAPWDHRPLVHVLIGQVVEQLGEPDGIIAFDPSSFPTRGTHSVGVKRQWCGHRGKVDNCQVGVFMGYVSRDDHALLDFRLSLPEAWARDQPRREACHVPPEVRYHTRQEQCLEMLDAWGDQVPHGWVTGDDELGRHSRFRGELRARGERYVLGVPCTTAVRDLEVPSPPYHGRGRRPKAPWQLVRAWRTSLPSAGWTHVTVRDGEKGPVEMEIVKRRVQTRLERKRTGPEEWLVITRHPLTDDTTSEGNSSRDAPEYDGRDCYRYYLTPTWVSSVECKEPPLAELARVITAGLCIEASFKRGKGEAGMDEYQVGRIRARYLTARLPNPPVRPVRETFASYGSRQRDIMGKVHFASSTVHSPWTALRVRWVPVYCFPTLSLRAFAMCTVFPHSDYYALFDCLLGLGVSYGFPHSYSPPSLTSLAGSPVFTIEDSSRML